MQIVVPEMKVQPRFLMGPAPAGAAGACQGDVERGGMAGLTCVKEIS
jgi:hypothetical protein